jgi:RNA polymerase sigma factor (TIGR02999 family)
MDLAPPPGTATPTQPPTTASARNADRLNQLFVKVQDELRRIAHRQLCAERPDDRLSTTALVHETYLKLAQHQRDAWDDRAQFLALASRAMRRILIDYARRPKQVRERARYDSSDATDDRALTDYSVGRVAAQRADELLALDEALERLEQFDVRLSRVVECLFFAGYTEEETAAALGVTARTVSGDWVKAKAWLFQELRGPATELPQ